MRKKRRVDVYTGGIGLALGGGAVSSTTLEKKKTCKPQEGTQEIAFDYLDGSYPYASVTLQARSLALDRLVKGSRAWANGFANLPFEQVCLCRSYGAVSIFFLM